jgi:hypothetical protein
VREHGPHAGGSSPRAGRGAALQRLAQWWWVFLAAAAIVTGFAIVQWMVCRDELRVEAESQAALAQMIASLNAILPKLEEFKRERQLLDEKLASVRRVMPAKLDPAAYVLGLQTECARYGLAIVDWTERAGAKDRLQNATINLKLAGRTESVEALGRRVETMARLATWTLLEAQGDRASARVVIYALAKPPASPSPAWCGPYHGRVWLWPFRGWLERARRAREAPCRELEFLRPVRVQVDALERDRQELGKIIKVSERLIEDRRGRKQ